LEEEKQGLVQLSGQKKEAEKQQLDKVLNDLQRERKDYEKQKSEYQARIRELEAACEKLKKELQEAHSAKE